MVDTEEPEVHLLKSKIENMEGIIQEKDESLKLKEKKISSLTPD